MKKNLAERCTLLIFWHFQKIGGRAQNRGFSWIFWKNVNIFIVNQNNYVQCIFTIHKKKIINNSDKWFFDRNEKTRENARFCALWPIFWKCQNLTSLQRSANFFFRKWQKSVQIFSSRNLNIVNACQGREIFLNAIKFGFFAYCAAVRIL